MHVKKTGTSDDDHTRTHTHTLHWCSATGNRLLIAAHCILMDGQFAYLSPAFVLLFYFPFLPFSFPVLALLLRLLGLLSHAQAGTLRSVHGTHSLLSTRLLFSASRLFGFSSCTATLLACSLLQGNHLAARSKARQGIVTTGCSDCASAGRQCRHRVDCLLSCGIRRGSPS